jgi:hypothetical protein
MPGIDRRTDTAASPIGPRASDDEAQSSPATCLPWWEVMGGSVRADRSKSSAAHSAQRLRHPLSGIPSDPIQTLKAFLWGWHRRKRALTQVQRQHDDDRQSERPEDEHGQQGA